MRLTDTPRARWGWIGGLTAASVTIVLLLAPRVDYLPVAQTDLIWNNFRLPPGGNLETARDEFAPVVIERLRPYLEGTKEPAIKYYNFSAFEGFGGTAVVYPKDPRDIQDMVSLLRDDLLAGLPDTPVFAARVAAQRGRRQRPRDPARFPGCGPDGADGRGADCRG